MLWPKRASLSQSFLLESSVDGWYFANILFGGLIGLLIVDPADRSSFEAAPFEAVFCLLGPIVLVFLGSSFPGRFKPFLKCVETWV